MLNSWVCVQKQLMYYLQSSEIIDIPVFHINSLS